MTPPATFEPPRSPPSGMPAVGHARCQRISRMKRKPTRRKSRLVTAYCRPMTL
jgi:hypothetical protein